MKIAVLLRIAFRPAKVVADQTIFWLTGNVERGL